MGQFQLRVDPNSINRTQVQAVIDDLNSRPGAQQYLNITNTNKSGDMYVTDNKDSPIFSQVNRSTLNAKDPRGFNQSPDNGTPITYINFDSPDGKAPINILVHEIGHVKWPGWGITDPHDPQFYRVLNDALKALGIPVDPELDLNNIDISNVRSPVPSGTSPLNYNKLYKRSDAGDDTGSADLANDQDSHQWEVGASSDGKTLSETKLSSDGSVVEKIDYTIGSDGQEQVRASSYGDGALETQVDVFTNGTSAIKYIDTKNTHPYSQLDVTKGTDGKVTAAQVALDPAVLAAGMSIGQIFGSALGGALGGNSLVGNLAGSTIGGLIGQKFVQVLATAMTADLSTVSLNDVFLGQGISVANAGIGAVSSFLTAELGHALHIDGFDGQLFNTAASSFTTSLLIQVTDEMARHSLDFAGAIAAIDWTQAVSNAINVAEINLGNLLGSYLGHELVPAQTREGAIGGQLFGAIGGYILGPLGSLIGTIIGTLIFNHFGTQPSPGAVDLLDQAGYFYGHSQYQSSDGGGYEISDKMAQAADDIVNAYLHAVNGAALDHSKQVALGYIKNPDLLFITGAPSNTNHSFTSADDAVHAAALDVLQNLEVIGGDLLMKRAHQNSPSNIPEAGPAGGGMPGQSQVSGADQLATMAGDLSVAQDYENYLNNREAINALIAANPNSAFAMGWIATFARVNDLGLNHMSKSDFLGGLVGYLDSVAKAGLGAEAANAIVKRGSDNSVIVEIKVASGVEVPGSLSVFADHLNITSDASGQTLQFTVNSGLGMSGTLLLGPGTGSAGHDIMTGGAADDTFHGGAGWDFIDGGAGADHLFGEDGNDILRGGPGSDDLQGGLGNDTYVFNRGDGTDTVLDDFTVTTTTTTWKSWIETRDDGTNVVMSGNVTETTTDHRNAGTNSLVFGPGISRADVVAQLSADGHTLTVGVKDPAHPGVPFGQLTDKITIQNWNDGSDRIESFAFADGTPLDAGTALTSFQVPFGESLSRSSVTENSANGTVVGTVSGFDFNPNAILTYSLVNPDGRFAINASSGVLTVANGLLLDYENSTSQTIRVQTADQSGHLFEKTFTIATIDVFEAPTGATLSGNRVVENAANGTRVGTVTGVDADPHAVLSYLLTDNAGGRFAINASSGEITVANGALLDYETATSWQIGVRTADQIGHVFDTPFTIAVTDVYEGPFGFEPATAPLAAFTIGAGGWSDQNQYPRQLADVNGDGMADIVGFENDGVAVSLAAGNGHFASATFELGAFAINADGWTDQNDYPRQLADVNGDGMADIVGFASGGVLVSLATGNGHFAASTSELAAFGLYIGGWTSQTLYPRLLGDVNGDGMADIVGFASGGVSVSLATGNGHFASPTFELAAFAINAGGWSSQDQYPRLLADVNGDGMADIVGFASGGVVVSLATGGGHFAPSIGETATFGFLAAAGGWTSQNQYPRLLADVNGDGMADIVGFGGDMAMVSLATGGGQFAAPVPGIRNFGLSAGGWGSQNLYPRDLGDVNGDGVADIIGFGQDGVYEALSNGFYHINHAPVLTVPASLLIANAGQSVQMSSLFSATDADNDALTYYFQDGTPAANSGHFVLNGTALAQGAGFGVNATQLASLVFVTGAEGVADDLSMQLSDGYAVSALGALHINVNHAPVLTVPANDISANAGQPLQVSSLFSASDADGDALTYYFQDGTLAANSGYFVLNGTPQAQGAGFSVNAAQLAGLTFVAGAVGFPDDWSMQLSDGRAVSAGEALHVSDLRAHAVVTDFNGDGRSDILWFRDDGTVSVWDNGDIAHAHWIADPGVVGSSWHIKGDGDFDGNHHDDILWQNDNAAVSVWDNGALAGAHIIAAAGAVAAGWQIAGVGDFDGNHQDDVLWRNDNGTVSIWDNGQLATAHVVAGAGAVPAGWHIDGIGDFDDNGRDDILWHNDDGRVSIWDNGQIAGAHLIVDPGVVASSWKVAGTGDFDGNGRLDILWRNDNGAVSIWDNGQIGGAHIVAAAGTVANSWHIEGVGDFDGNGRDDVLWRRDDATVSVWDNGELAHAHWIADPGQVANSWHIA